MTFHVCGQCAYFQRETHPEDEDQFGDCMGLPPQLIVFEGQIYSMYPTTDPGSRACGLFKEDRR